jgi:hypothetical protein
MIGVESLIGFVRAGDTSESVPYLMNLPGSNAQDIHFHVRVSSNTFLTSSKRKGFFNPAWKP